MSGGALLFDAIERYYGLLTAEDEQAAAALAELEAWFASPDRHTPGAFEQLCEERGIDAALVRSILRQRRTIVRRV